MKADFLTQEIAKNTLRSQPSSAEIVVTVETFKTKKPQSRGTNERDNLENLITSYRETIHLEIPICNETDMNELPPQIIIAEIIFRTTTGLVQKETFEDRMRNLSRKLYVKYFNDEISRKYGGVEILSLSLEVTLHDDFGDYQHDENGKRILKLWEPNNPE